MGENTKIEWADSTFNPWVGCQKISPACTNCYAEGWAKRTGSLDLWRGERRRTSQANWRQPLRWNEETPGARVFCASLADVFEARANLNPWREDLFELIGQTPRLSWLLLTKRPEVAAAWFERHPMPDNVWMGTTVEDQKRADERIPHLLRVPARVRFLSCEPLLGPVNLRHVAPRDDWDIDALDTPDPSCRIHWVIAGGESGPRARPSHPQWFRDLRDQCVSAGVPYLFKQHGDLLAACQATDDAQRVRPIEVPSPNNPAKSNTYYRPGKVLAGRLLDGRTWDELPAVSP